MTPPEYRKGPINDWPTICPLSLIAVAVPTLSVSMGSQRRRSRERDIRAAATLSRSRHAGGLSAGIDGEGDVAAEVGDLLRPDGLSPERGGETGDERQRPGPGAMILRAQPAVGGKGAGRGSTAGED